MPEIDPLWLSLWAHFFGDYVLQSDYMALRKRRSFGVALLHAVTYTVPFLLVTRSLGALAVICLTHAIIDHFGLARYVCWAKNFLAPRWIAYAPPESGWTTTERVRNLPWKVCTATGYPPDRPAWLTTWLLIITDNWMHITINAAAILFL